MTEHKLRKALQAAYEAHKDDFEQPWLSLAAEALAAPSSEQVELTDAEILGVLLLTAQQGLPSIERVRGVIAAHEAKRGGTA